MIILVIIVQYQFFVHFLRRKKLSNNSGKFQFLIVSLILFVFLSSGVALGEEDITVYAPIGLKSVFMEIERKFEKEEGITVKTVFLVHQDLKNATKTKGGDLIATVYPDLTMLNRDIGDMAEKPIKVAYLEPLIYVKKGNPLNIKKFDDLGKPGVKLLVMDRKGKPFKGLIERTIEKSYITEKIKNNTVKSHMNGTKVLRWLIAGEGDAAIAVKSLSTWNEFKDLETIKVPTRITVSDQVFISELTSSKLFDKLKVISYIKFVKSDEGRRIFTKYGFSIPRN